MQKALILLARIFSSYFLFSGCVLFHSSLIATAGVLHGSRVFFPYFLHFARSSNVAVAVVADDDGAEGFYLLFYKQFSTAFSFVYLSAYSSSPLRRCFEVFFFA